MSKTVTVRFVPPPPIREELKGGRIKTRRWDGEKLRDTLDAGLQVSLPSLIPGAEVRVLLARAPEIRFEGWKPAKADELREAVGELIGVVLEEIDASEYLLDA